GRTADGCPSLQTELWSASGASAGPRLPQGRLQSSAVALPSGEVALMGGLQFDGCEASQPAEQALIIDPLRNSVRMQDTGGPVPEGAAVAVVDDSLVLWAGGAAETSYRTAVRG
ncbi:unnamed protein product, partial [Laminaria digitata]